MQKYNHIIFDLGGVLIELGNTPIPEDLFSISKKVTLKEWFALPVAHAFEQGRVSKEHLADKFIKDFDLEITVEEFIEKFSQWPKRVSNGAKELLLRLSEDYQLSVLSNCNEIHWPLMESKFDILKYFNHKFSSHLIGLTKPDVAIYKYVLEKLNTHPSKVIFFDDNVHNIEAANTVGIKGVVVKGIKEVINHLEREKIL